MYDIPLKYHFRPKKGWINDPNGLVYYKGYYHVFYQHSLNFEEPWHEAMHWGHARTKDFIDWEELPVALYPDQPYDCGGCWSGTAIVQDDTLYLFYASVHVPAGEAEKRQTVSMACSTDGISFTKYEHNPVIDGFPADGSADFRDPAVTCIDGLYYCVMASGNRGKNTANLLLYKSDDLLHWQYQGVMCEWSNSFFAECPSFMPYGDEFLLAASVCYEGGHRFAIMFGDFKDSRFMVRQSAGLDRGPDQYAGQVFMDGRGRAILISWMFGWDYQGYAARDIGCMSLPKQLFHEGNRIFCRPVEEVSHLLQDGDLALEVHDGGFTVRRLNREPL